MRNRQDCSIEPRTEPRSVFFVRQCRYSAVIRLFTCHSVDKKERILDFTLEAPEIFHFTSRFVVVLVSPRVKVLQLLLFDLHFLSLSLIFLPALNSSASRFFYLFFFPSILAQKWLHNFEAFVMLVKWIKHFKGKNVPSYMPRAVIREYLIGKHNVKKNSLLLSNCPHMSSSAQDKSLRYH